MLPTMMGYPQPQLLPVRGQGQDGRVAYWTGSQVLSHSPGLRWDTHTFVVEQVQEEPTVPAFKVIPRAQGLTGEVVHVDIDFSTPVFVVSGNYAIQRAMLIRQPEYTAGDSRTIGQAATLAIEGAPLGTTGATITNPYALWVQSGLVRLGGNLLVDGLINSPWGCRLTHSTGVNISHNTDTTLTWDTERWDNGGFHSTTSNPSRITIPAGMGGYYIVGASIRFGNEDTDGFRQLSLIWNGGDALIRERQAAIPSSIQLMSVNTVWRFSAGDYVEVQVYQNSGSTITLPRVNAYSPEFWIHRLA